MEVNVLFIKDATVPGASADWNLLIPKFLNFCPGDLFFYSLNPPFQFYGRQIFVRFMSKINYKILALYFSDR